MTDDDLPQHRADTETDKAPPESPLEIYTVPLVRPLRLLMMQLGIITALFILGGLALRFLWHLPGWGVFILLFGLGVNIVLTWYYLWGDPTGPL